MPGILGSRIGHHAGNEIVEVDYDPQKITLAEMVQALKNESSFYSVMAPDQTAREAVRTALPDTEVTLTRGEPEFIESKHSLRTRFPDLYYLDLTEKQAIALNSWSYFGGAMPDVLSPEQRTLRPRLRTTIGQRGEPPFQPVRSGEGRERYRKRLLQWLGDRRWEMGDGRKPRSSISEYAHASQGGGRALGPHLSALS